MIYTVFMEKLVYLLNGSQVHSEQQGVPGVQFESVHCKRHAIPQSTHSQLHWLLLQPLNDNKIINKIAAIKNIQY